MNNIEQFRIKKLKDEKITMITCYDFWSAKILANTNIDAILVGDSVSMVMHGASSTVDATIPMMEAHIKAVRRGIGNKFIVGDLPFLSYKKSLYDTMTSIDILMKAGANAVKLEGVTGDEQTIKHIINSGVPVMGHLGFTPQSVNMFGNSLVRGKQEEEALKIIDDALKLQELGCFSIVLECIPAKLAEDITSKLSIPTIGIGSGADTSGQILVLQDLLGADADFNPKFLKKYLDINSLMKNAVNEYCQEVENKTFPNKSNCYSASTSSAGNPYSGGKK